MTMFGKAPGFKYNPLEKSSPGGDSHGLFSGRDQQPYHNKVHSFDYIPKIIDNDFSGM